MTTSPKLNDFCRSHLDPSDIEDGYLNNCKIKKARGLDCVRVEDSDGTVEYYHRSHRLAEPMMYETVGDVLNRLQAKLAEQDRKRERFASIGAGYPRECRGRGFSGRVVGSCTCEDGTQVEVEHNPEDILSLEDKLFEAASQHRKAQ